MESSDLLIRLAQAAAAHAPFDGWSEKAFRAAAADCALSADEARLMAPRGALDLAAAFHRAADSEMVRRLEGSDLSRLKFRERVAWAVRLRLELVERDREDTQAHRLTVSQSERIPQGVYARLHFGVHRDRQQDGH